MTPDPIRACVLGAGTVGRAFLARLAGDDDLARRVRIVAAADRRAAAFDAKGLDPAAMLARKRAGEPVVEGPPIAPLDVARRADADVLVDLTPTDLRDARASTEVALAALDRGMDVVTANKGPLALDGRRLRERTAATGRRVLGSATVCAGTPVLELLNAAARGDRLDRIEGVLSGSANFVMSLVETGVPFSTALEEARLLGILEADPSMDVLGLDAAAKSVILANAAWGLDLALEDARVQGILDVRAREAIEARGSGFAIRLVARATRAEGVAVAPVALPRDHPLVVDHRQNVVRFRYRDAGDVVLRGAGAGGPETASAVVSDCLRLLDSRSAAPRGRAEAPRIVAGG